jgi:hypothetical protein
VRWDRELKRIFKSRPRRLLRYHRINLFALVAMGAMALTTLEVKPFGDEIAKLLLSPVRTKIFEHASGCASWGIADHG